MVADHSRRRNCTCTSRVVRVGFSRRTPGFAPQEKPIFFSLILHASHLSHFAVGFMSLPLCYTQTKPHTLFSMYLSAPSSPASISLSSSLVNLNSTSALTFDALRAPPDDLDVNDFFHSPLAFSALIFDSAAGEVIRVGVPEIASWFELNLKGDRRSSSTLRYVTLPRFEIFAVTSIGGAKKSRAKLHLPLQTRNYTPKMKKANMGAFMGVAAVI
ncbi:hypothetical protein N7462_006509 [Penicillium macrosclerotiorum]|uniref:uncharacterized protein n=1 Tax=Penicillium macrosclerotiorum TaxID=303699 RepID=UPI002548740C|nr:uncharacterized protein N7462_006509 [Penicillium macrosclerotiorum]KAJ5683344.1 hypothetical protein N7462_006509 [Penicillium macrosclerotiorum]